MKQEMLLTKLLGRVSRTQQRYTKTLCIFLGFILVVVMMSSQASLAENVIANKGFELGTSDPFSDGVVRGTVTLEKNSDYVHSGRWSLRHVATENNSFTSPWKGSNRIAISPSTTLRFSVWAKAAAPNTRIRILIFSLDENDQTSAQYWQDQNFLAGPDWEQYSVLYVCPADHTQASIRLDVRDAGRTVWWDDPIFECVTNPIDNPGLEEQVLPVPFSTALRGELALDDTESHKGNSSLKHTATDDDSYTKPYKGESAVLAPAEAGDTFVFTSWFKGSDTVPVQMRIFALDAAYVPLDHGLTSFTAQGDWTQGSISYTCPEGTQSVSVRLDNDGGSGSVVWWDDLILKKQVQESGVLFIDPSLATVHDLESYNLGVVAGQQHFSLVLPPSATGLALTNIQGSVAVNLTADPYYGQVYNGLVHYTHTDTDPGPFTTQMMFQQGSDDVTFYVTGTVKNSDWWIERTFSTPHRHSL